MNFVHCKETPCRPLPTQAVLWFCDSPTGCYLLSSAPLMVVGPTPQPHPQLHAGRSSPRYSCNSLHLEI